MLKPAINYKEEIIKKFNNLRYSDYAMFYNGCIEDGNIWICSDEYSDGVFQYAILDGEKVVGFISWRVDYYSANAYNFGLVSFTPDKPSMAIALGINQAIKIIKAQNIARVEFGAVDGNPAIKHYDKICDMQEDWAWTKFEIPLAFRDRRGKYRSRYIYLLINKHHEFDI